MILRRLGLLVAAVLVALGGSLAAASPASAHNVLRGVTPQDGSTVDRVPAEVVLTFDEPALAMGTALVVTGPNGPVTDGAARLVDTTVRQSLRPGSPAGTYTVNWRVTSVDGHPIRGTFTFTARAAGSAAPSPASTAPATPRAGDSSPAHPVQRVPAWVWPVIAAALVLSALTSAAAARRRNRRGRPD